MKLVLMGPAGSGKGSIAQRICPIFGIPQIAMGDLLRGEIANKSEIGREAEQYTTRGLLVPDRLTFVLLRKRIKQPDAQKGFILDGFPRNMEQAQELEKITGLDAVVYLNVPEDILITRLSSRVSCKKCNKIYNTLFLKPKTAGVCDACGGELYRRADDTPEAIKKRLHEQWKQTEPLVGYYKQKGLLREVDVNDMNAPPEDNANKVLGALGRKERLPVSKA